MKTMSLVILAVLTISLVAINTSAHAQKKMMKKRIAVFVFDDKTDRSFGWWNKKGVGEGLSDMLVTELVKTGNYRVIERAELDEVLKEQALGKSGIVTPESAAEVGKVLGVEIAIMGAVTEFGYKESDTGGRVKNFGLGVSSQTASVAVDVRLVNTETAEILTAESVRKEESSRGIKVDTRKIDFESQKKFDESIVGIAARNAVNDVIAMVDKGAPKVKWQAKVVTERDGMVFINAGSEVGLGDGDKLFVYRPGEALIDPDTGLNLGSIESKVGQIEVTNASVGNGKAAQCRIISGSGFQKGDLVRLE